MNQNCFIFYITLGVFYLISFFLNKMTPLTGDDYSYSFIFNTSERISSLKDIFTSQYYHYYQWGGRSVVHFIAQTLLFIKNELLVDIINSLAYTLSILFIYIHIVGKKIISNSLLVILFCLNWFLQPTFAETTLWITGSSNYLWGTLLILTFLLPFRLYKEKKTTSILSIIGLSIYTFIFGIIAGWTNENTAAGMLSIIILFLLFYKYNRWSIPVWGYSGLTGALLGYIIMIMAPGNFVRAEGTFIDLFVVIYRTLMASKNFIYYLGILNLGAIIFLILYHQFAESSLKKAVLFYSTTYLIGTLISIYIMAGSPGFPPRAWYGPITFNIIFFGILFFNQNDNILFIQKIKTAFVIFCIIGFGFSFNDAYKDVTAINQIWKERRMIIKQKKQENASSVSFKEYQAKTKYGLGDATYALKYISNYYELEFKLEK